MMFYVYKTFTWGTIATVAAGTTFLTGFVAGAMFQKELDKTKDKTETPVS